MLTSHIIVIKIRCVKLAQTLNIRNSTLEMCANLFNMLEDTYIQFLKSINQRKN